MESKISVNGWIRVGTIRSESNAEQVYILGTREEKGECVFGCDCPSRKYRKGTKAHAGFSVTCKHARAILDGTASIGNVSLTSEGACFLDALKANPKTAEGNKVALAQTRAKVAASKVA